MRKHPSQVEGSARSAYAVGSPQVHGLRHIIWSFSSLVWLSGIPLFTAGAVHFFGVSRFSIPLHNTGKDSGMRKTSDSCAGVFILLIRSVDLQDFEIAGGDIGTGWKGLSCFEINSVLLPGFRLQRMSGRVEQDQELFFRIVFPVKSGT